MIWDLFWVAHTLLGELLLVRCQRSKPSQPPPLVTLNMLLPRLAHAMLPGYIIDCIALTSHRSWQPRSIAIIKRPSALQKISNLTLSLNISMYMFIYLGQGLRWDRYGLICPYRRECRGLVHKRISPDQTREVHLWERTDTRLRGSVVGVWERWLWSGWCCGMCVEAGVRRNSLGLYIPF